MAARMILGAFGACAIMIALQGCQDEKAMTADVSLCQKVAQMAHQSPSGFEIVSEEHEETSEGVEVTLHVKYAEPSGETAQVKDRCWFDALKNNAMTKFFVERDGKLEPIPSEELAQYLQQVSG